MSTKKCCGSWKGSHIDDVVLQAQEFALCVLMVGPCVSAFLPNLFSHFCTKWKAKERAAAQAGNVFLLKSKIFGMIDMCVRWSFTRVPKDSVVDCIIKQLCVVCSLLDCHYRVNVQASAPRANTIMYRQQSLSLVAVACHLKFYRCRAAW